MVASAQPIVEARQLQKSYKGFKALGPIDVSIAHGAVGLLGPNGAGKTTFIKTLLGLIPVTSGSASVLGLDVSTQQLNIRQRVGYMPERDAQIINMTGFQY